MKRSEKIIDRLIGLGTNRVNKENSIEEKLATVEITEKVLREMNYFG